MEDWTSLGQHKRHPEFPVVTRESRRNSRKTTGVGKIPWKRAWQPTPLFLPGESPWTEEPGGLQYMVSQRVGQCDLEDRVPGRNDIYIEKMKDEREILMAG